MRTLLKTSKHNALKVISCCSQEHLEGIALDPWIPALEQGGNGLAGAHGEEKQRDRAYREEDKLLKLGEDQVQASLIQGQDKDASYINDVPHLRYVTRGVWIKP
ncbi:hypothetical protein Tco_0369155 [Tanacetum coccineum]